jgi:hypothetical protein
VNGSKAVYTAAMVVFLFATLCPAAAPNAEAQTATAFTPADKFPIPQNNGTVSFAVNGSYSSATLTDGMWVFTDLRLNDSDFQRTMKVSTLNSNMTIISYGPYGNDVFGHIFIIAYYADGVGQQIIDAGLNSSWSDPTEWSVIVNNSVFLAKDKGWTFSADNSFVVTGQTGLIGLVRFGFLNPQGDKNQPFMVKHSVIITTGIALAAVSAVGVVVYARRKK